jgi:hypothetical protein
MSLTTWHSVDNIVYVDAVRQCLWTAAYCRGYCLSSDDVWIWRATAEWHLQGNWKSSEKNMSQCHFVHHKSQRTDQGAKAGLRGERPATNRLSHKRALASMLVFWVVWPCGLEGRNQCLRETYCLYYQTHVCSQLWFPSYKSTHRYNPEEKQTFLNDN